MSNYFDPENLTPAASINRIRVVDLPGMDVDDCVRGKTSYGLLSLDSVYVYVQDQLNEIGDGTEYRRLISEFDAYLNSSDSRVHQAAEAVARRIGRNLGYIVLTLKRGDRVNRAARPDCSEQYWEYWAKIKNIRLGGGLASGTLGARIQYYASELFAEAGLDDFALTVASHPAILPLIGAARSVPVSTQAAVVLDFGQTFIKRACAVYDAGGLARLHLLPSLQASPLLSPTQSNEHAIQKQNALALGGSMLEVMDQAWRIARELIGADASFVVVSIASYTTDGQPADYMHSGYPQIRFISSNVGGWFGQELSTRLRYDLSLSFIHDGTAAARTYAGEPHTAVITMGTALGIGFPPGADKVVPLAPGFLIV